jgi:hypothetical protein
MFNNNTFQIFIADFSAKSVDNFSARGFDLTARFFDFLAELKTEFVLEAAMHNIGNEIKFYFAIPRKSAEKAEEKMKSIWNSVEIKKVYGYGIFNPLGSVSGLYFRQKMPPVFSIGHRMKNDFSVFPSYLSGFSEVNEVGEGAAIQVICRPAENSFKKEVSKMVEKISRGTDWRIALKDYLPEINKSNGDDFSREDILKSLKFKALHPAFSVNARIIVSAPSQFQTDEIISRFADGLNPIRKSFFGLKIIKPSDARGMAESFLARNFQKKQEMVLNSRELATIFNFPQGQL